MNNEKKSIYYFSGTHWDREWYQPFQGFRYRLVSVMNEVISVLENDPEFKVFHFDGQTIVLEDFLEIEPDKKERLKRLIKEGKLVVGPWYVMPDEFLVSGESLIRNLLVGHRMSAEFGAQAWKYGYVCDVFGHIAQMPQIFAGFDIQYALLGRGTNEHTTPAHFIWKSPDGSECITFKLEDQNGYGSFCVGVLGCNEQRYTDIQTLYPKIKEFVESEFKRSDIPVVLLMDGLDHESIHKDVPRFMDMIKELFPNANVQNVNLENMGKELESYRQLMPVKTGEINETAKSKASYIHLITHTLSSRYPIKKANDECQVLLEKWVEPLTAIAELRGLATQRSYIDLAYKYLLQNHPHDSICGCSIDQVHKDMEYRFRQCREISNQLIEEVLHFECNLHTVQKDSQTRVLLLWNPLPFSRKEVLTLDIDFNTGYQTKYEEPFNYEKRNSFKILNSHGDEVPYGLIRIKKDYTVRRLNQLVEQKDIHTVTFEAEVPAMGTAEYKIVPFEEASRYLACLSKSEQMVENEYLKLKINCDGTVNILDKCSGREYSNLLSYVDDGEIGDGWYHVNPTEDSVVSSIGCECTVEKIENGPSRTVFKVTNYMRVPDSMDYDTHGIRRSLNYTVLKICSLIGLSRRNRYIDVETTVSNNAKDHRLRLKIPTGIHDSRYFANQAFTFVERSTGINYDTQSWMECDVLEKQMGGIVGKRDAEKTGLAFVSAFGLHECGARDDENGTVLVTLFRSFGKTVMTNGEEGGQILEDLKFKYNIMPLQSDTTYADMIRRQDCLQAGIQCKSFQVSEDYVLPAPKSYFELSGDNICLSTLKRPENGENGRLVVRLYNMSESCSQATLHCFKQVKSVQEMNLNEEATGVLSAAGKTIVTELKPWKIKTLCLIF